MLNVTIDAAEALQEETKETNSPKENEKKVFDEKNYLNTQLKKGETRREIQIRLLPFEDSKPFKMIHTHTVKLSDKLLPQGAKSNLKSYICLGKTKSIPDKFGDKCPFCELQKRAFEKSKAATTESDKKLYWDVAINNYAKPAYIARVIERGKEDEGVKFWKINGSQNKSSAYDMIMELFNQRRSDGRSVNQDINIFDINNGRDIKLIIEKGDTEGSKPKIKVLDIGASSPLSSNEELMKEWIYDEKKWYDVFPPKPYEYLSLIIEDEKPWFDNEEKKWVSKEEFDKTHGSYQAPISDYDNFNAPEDSLPENINNETSENSKNDDDDDDLPF